MYKYLTTFLNFILLNFSHTTFYNLIDSIGPSSIIIFPSEYITTFISNNINIIYIFNFSNINSDSHSINLFLFINISSNLLNPFVIKIILFLSN